MGFGRDFPRRRRLPWLSGELVPGEVTGPLSTAFSQKVGLPFPKTRYGREA